MKRIKHLWALILSISLLMSSCATAGESEVTDTNSNSDNMQEVNEHITAQGDGLKGDLYDITDYDYSSGIDENGFFIGVKALDYIKLPDYKNVEITDDLIKAPEEAVQAEINSILEGYATHTQVKDREVKQGDTVNIDYVGTINGVEFSGGNTGGNGTTVTIGVTNYIDDFLDQLVGHKPGETIKVEVTFPQDYGVEDLNGKDAVFTTTINYIDVAEAIPELTEAIAKEYGFDTIDAMVESIEEFLVGVARFEFFYELAIKSEYTEIPAAVKQYIINNDIEQFNVYAYQYGYTLPAYIYLATGYTDIDDYIKANEKFYVETSLLYLTAQAIAEQEGLMPTEEDIERRGLTSEVDNYGIPYIKQTLLYDEIIPNWIVNTALDNK